MKISTKEQLEKSEKEKQFIAQNMNTMGNKQMADILNVRPQRVCHFVMKLGGRTPEARKKVGQTGRHTNKTGKKKIKEKEKEKQKNYHIPATYKNHIIDLCKWVIKATKEDECIDQCIQQIRELRKKAKINN